MTSELTRALCPLDNQKDTTSNPLPRKSCNVAFFGRRGCGKTTLLLNLLMRKESPWYKFFDLIFLCSPTARNDDKMKDLIDDIGDQYYETLNNDVLQDIMDRCEAHTQMLSKKKKKRKGDYCIIYDDCIHMIKSKHANLINKLATQNRHMGISNVYLLQKYNSFMPPLLRSNLDCTAFFRTENQAELDSFLKEIGTNENKLRSIYDYATDEKFSFLFINNYSHPMKFYKRFDQIEWREKKPSQE